jgi:hypothetical protein
MIFSAVTIVKQSRQQWTKSKKKCVAIEEFVVRANLLFVVEVPFLANASLSAIANIPERDNLKKFKFI